MTKANLAALKAEMSAAGSFFWSRGAMKFFNSRSTTAVTESYDKRRVYFVTSERFDDTTPRRYTVRMWDRDVKQENTIGEFQQYRDLRTARNAMYGMVDPAREGA